MNKEAETPGAKKEKAGNKSEQGGAAPKGKDSVEVFSDTLISIFRKLLTVQNLEDLPKVVKKIDKEFPDGNIPSSIVESFARRLDLLKSDSEVQIEFADETAIRRLVRNGEHEELGNLLKKVAEKESGGRGEEEGRTKTQIEKDIEGFVGTIEKKTWVGKEKIANKGLVKIETAREGALKTKRGELKKDKDVSGSVERVSGKMISESMKVVEKMSRENIDSTVSKLKKEMEILEKNAEMDSLQKLALFKSKRAVEVFEKIQKAAGEKGELSPEVYSRLSSEEMFVLQRMFADESMKSVLPEELITEAEEVYRKSRTESAPSASVEEHLRQVAERGFGNEMLPNDIDRISAALKKQDQLFDVMFDSQYNLRPNHDALLQEQFGSRSRGGRFEKLFAELVKNEMFVNGDGGRYKVNPEYDGDVEDIYTEWFQTTLVEVRKLAEESVETRDFYFDERAQKYLTLLSVEGIPAKYKQRVRFDMKQYHAIEMMYGRYVDGEAFQTLLSVWSENSPDYALFSELRRNERFYVDSERRGESVGEFNVFDFVKHISRKMDKNDIYDVAKNEIDLVTGHTKYDDNNWGIEGYDISRSWGTMLLKYNEPKKRAEVRMRFFEEVLKDKLGNIEGYDGDQLEHLYESYEDYIDRAIYYLIATNELGEVVGNTSFAENEFQLPQGLPEFFYKTDRRLLRYFLAKYGVHVVPEAISVLDVSIPSLSQYAKGEIMNHFTSVETSGEGAPGALETFFGGNRDHKNRAEKLVEVISPALYHWGEDTKSNFLSYGAEDKDNKSKTGMKPADWMIIEALRKANPGNDVLEAIDWEKFMEITGVEITGEEGWQRWSSFVENFSDQYFNWDTFYAKRVQDFQHKYRGKNHPEWYSEVGIPLAADPFNMENVMKMILTVDGMTSSSGIRDRAMKVIFDWIARDLGVGESVDRYKLDGGAIQWSGNAEFPDVRMEKMTNINKPFDPIKKRSIYESRKGREVTKELKKVFIDDARSQGLLKDDTTFRKYKLKERLSIIWPHQWTTPVGFVLNVVRTPGGLLIRLPAEMLGLTPKEFWQILIEEGVIGTFQLLWKHLNG